MVSIFFNDFPRDVGVPYRRLCASYEEFRRIARKSTEHPVYIQLYVNDTYDKIWVDLDSSSVIKVHQEAKIIYNRLVELGVDQKHIVVVYTGKKGYHIYVRLKPERYDVATARSYLHQVWGAITLGLQTPDRPIFSDTNRIVRIPGIQRPNGMMPVVLDPQVFLECNSIHEYVEKFNQRWMVIMDVGADLLHKLWMHRGVFTLEELFKCTKNIKVPDSLSSVASRKKQAVQQAAPQQTSKDYIRKLVGNDRLCTAIFRPNPFHHERVRFAVSLLKRGLDVDDVVDVISTLKWLDFDPAITRYHVMDLYQRYILKRGVLHQTQ